MQGNKQCFKCGDKATNRITEHLVTPIMYDREIWLCDKCLALLLGFLFSHAYIVRQVGEYRTSREVVIPEGMFDN